MTFYVEWHAPIWSLEGPGPLLEVDDLIALKASDVHLTMEQCSEDELIENASAEWRYKGRLNEFRVPERVSTIVYYRRDAAEVSVTARLREEDNIRFEAMLLAYVSAPFPKQYCISVSRPRLRHPEADTGAPTRDDFINSGLPSLSEDEPRFQFSFGIHREPMSERAFLSQLGTYF
ncbi:hypothetical protein ACVDG3_21215 [Meridianimarinicoccus sp. RP-17]|uniref:hypothetical protein n=1 Tax=Meridianimarinicoccus zhengii TaxID=2056810 RepID=UPI0013A6897D|nr:hypothetical protein [Phycocomes zhengii]